MTKGETLSLFRNLNQLGILTGAKFTYAVARNISLLKGEIEALEKSMELPDKFKEFETERIALVEKYAEKDDNGKPKKETTDSGAEQYIMGDEKKFEKEFEVLKVKHKEAVSLREKQIEEYTKLLVTDSDFKPYMLKKDDLPETINARQLSGIYEIIEE